MVVVDGDGDDDMMMMLMMMMLVMMMLMMVTLILLVWFLFVGLVLQFLGSHGICATRALGITEKGCGVG